MTRLTFESIPAVSEHPIRNTDSSIKAVGARG